MPEGYTVSELLVLARSSLPAHRCAALGMLRLLLLKARPTPAQVPLPGGPTKAQPIPIPPELLAQAASRNSSSSSSSSTAAAAAKQGPAAAALAAAAASAAWPQLWDYMVRELGLGSHLRLALDDQHTPVVAAAAAAIAALVCPGPEEAAAWEAADCCPRLGWPALHSQPLARPHPGGTWEAQSVEAVQQQGPPRPPVGPGEDEEATPEDVVAADPVAGLLQMQVRLWL